MLLGEALIRSEKLPRGFSQLAEPVAQNCRERVAVHWLSLPLTYREELAIAP